MRKTHEINAETRIDAWKAAVMFAVIGCFLGAPSIAWAGNYFNGFEVDTYNWFDLTRVASGTGGVTSASGGYHAINDTDPNPFTRWGGYNDDPACAGGGTCPGSFPAYGFDTSLDVYLDVDGGYANDSRVDYTSAISDPSGNHRRDFIFNCGFYNDDQSGSGLGSGNRFICSASNNTPGWPANPGRDPAVIATTSGWYTFLHEFRDDGTGVLTVRLRVLDSSGTEIHAWTLSDPTDVIGTTVGGNRYGWFPYNQLGTTLAFDNASRTSLPPAYSCDGFEPPMNLAYLPPAMGGGEIGRSVKRNRVLPFKATLLDGDGNPVTALNSPPVIQVTYVPTVGPSADVTPDALTSGKRSDGNQFELTGDSWAFNLWTKNYTAVGRYEATMVSGDPSEYVIDPTCRGVFVIEP